MDEAAGVDETDIGVGRILGEYKAGARKIAEQAFGIDRILGAAKADKADDNGFRLMFGPRFHVD